jgi:hypothetical protein
VATTGSISTKGLDEYLEAIVKMGRDVDDAAAQAALAGAEVLRGTMHDFAAELTGNLRAHILVFGPLQDGNYIYVEVGVIRRNGLVDADTLRYANAQEYGWNGQQHSHPFVRPGLATGRSPARRAMIDKLRGWLA